MYSPGCEVICFTIAQVEDIEKGMDEGQVRVPNMPLTSLPLHKSRTSDNNYFLAGKLWNVAK